MTGIMKLSKVMKRHGSIVSIWMGYLCLSLSAVSPSIFRHPALLIIASNPHVRQHYEMSRLKRGQMDVWHFSQIGYLIHIHFRI
jgi:hypothetical protein